jgi:hypothetical protein
MTMSVQSPLRVAAIGLVAVLLATASPAPVHAHRGPTASELSAASMLPVAVSVVAPAVLLVSGATLVVVSSAAVAQGTVFVLERASDGARASLVLSGDLAVGASVAAGTVVAVSAIGAGWVLSAAGRAIAFVPNEIGRALMHDERLTR